MGYWIPVGDGVRIYESTLKDAYTSAARILLGLYRRTNGNVHKVVAEYTGINGLPIYDTQRGKACNHWVRFGDGNSPKSGYAEVSYGKSYGVAFKEKSYPKNW